MSDEDVQRRISELEAQLHALRARQGEGSELDPEDQARLRRLEIDIDREWDLRRQRGALREAGQPPRDAALRDERTVEGYGQ